MKTSLARENSSVSTGRLELIFEEAWFVFRCSGVCGTDN